MTEEQFKNLKEGDNLNCFQDVTSHLAKIEAGTNMIVQLVSTLFVKAISKEGIIYRFQSKAGFQILKESFNLL